MKALIGADPEVFLTNGSKIVSAIGVVPGSKEHPHPTEHGWVQPDNVLAEFNIPPASSRDEFLHSIRNVMQDLAQYGNLAIQASHEFTKEELQASGRAAFVFGCDPDFDAWNGGIPNPRPNPAKVGGLRTAGGHVHIGHELAKQRPLDVVRGMDVLLGLHSVEMDPDVRRRSMYGRAGAFREKPYGVEYRTLSNFWLLRDCDIQWVYNQSLRVLEELDALTEFCNKHSDDIQQAINTSNAALAADLLGEYYAKVANG